jgi:carboxyl-terminal processing protease
MLLILACLACTSETSRTSRPAPITDREGLTHLVDSATALMQRHALRRDRIDWPSLIAAAHRAAVGSPSLTADSAYRIIREALRQLGDHHSLLLDPTVAARLWNRDSTSNDSPTVELRGATIGYVRVPKYVGFESRAMRDYARHLQTAIGAIGTLGACTWIVDLRGNTGGNMWPMLAGLGPLLGEGTAGGFLSPDGLVPWGYRRGEAWSRSTAQVRVASPVTLTPLPPVAVLTDTQTVSSGEAITIAFRGRPRTRSFGQATRGLSTGNQAFPLPDGSMLFLTTVVDADRTGRAYGGPVSPDELTPPESTEERARAWLAAQDCPGPAT